LADVLTAVTSLLYWKIEFQMCESGRFHKAVLCLLFRTK
jgi:hypothetical protein